MWELQTTLKILYNYVGKQTTLKKLAETSHFLPYLSISNCINQLLTSSLFNLDHGTSVFVKPICYYCRYR